MKRHGGEMKLKTLTGVTAIALFAALANPVRLAAQEKSEQLVQQQHKNLRYKLVDIGTFGGPVSTIDGDNGATGASAQFLNNQGVIGGTADTSAIDPNAPNCFNNDCFVAHSFRWQKGKLTDLGTLPGGLSSDVKAISGNGLIAGQSQIGVMDSLNPGFPEFHPALWQNGKVIDLGTLGGNVGAAFDVNNRGQVVGATSNTVPDPFSFVGTQIRGFLWQDGLMRDLGTLGGPEAWALFVNERGQVAGFSYTSFNPNPDSGVPTQDPFLWENGTMLDLGTFGGTNGTPNCLNNRGQVVGASNLPGDAMFHPFLWDSGVLTDLGTFGGSNGTAHWINDAGEVVGTANFPGDQINDAFLWKKGVMTDLGNLGQTSFAFYINSQGQVVGHSKMNDGTFHAFLWDKSGPMIDLNSLIPAGSSLLLREAFNINDRGEISGVGLPPGCEDSEICGHAYVLIPREGDQEDGDVGTTATTQSYPTLASQTAPAAAQRRQNNATRWFRSEIDCPVGIASPAS